MFRGLYGPERARAGQRSKLRIAELFEFVVARARARARAGQPKGGGGIGQRTNSASC